MFICNFQSSELPNSVYDVPWERMTISNQKIILVLLSRVQPDLVFKAFAGLEAGINPTISVSRYRYLCS